MPVFQALRCFQMGLFPSISACPAQSGFTGIFCRAKTKEGGTTLKRFQKSISAFLCCIMACSLCTALPPVKAEAADAANVVVQQKGSIGLTVCFDLPQTRESVEESGLQLTLSGGGKQGVIDLNSGSLSGGLSGRVSVLQKNTEGTELTTEQQIGYLEAEVSGLDSGSYKMTLSGKGYADFSQNVQLSDYSRHIIVSTAGGAFALGDADGNGSVNENDRSMIAKHLDEKNVSAACDLNGDGEVDLIDLVYISRSLGLSPETQVLETATIARLVVDTNGLNIEGSLNDLFADNETAVKIAPVSAGVISIPIDLGSGVEMSEIDITTPTVAGEVLAGTVELELADGKKETVAFDQSRPEGVHAIGRVAGQNVITIPLGRKVAVKKVTITVTRVEGQNGANPEFAVVTQIEFLKDIVPDAPSDTSQVKGVKAVPGDGSVMLSWNSVRNVTGYSVAYGTAPDALKQTSTTKTNSATIDGLDNMKEYYFQITATNGSWKGTPSELVSATPQSMKIPGAPSNIRVESADRALRVSWGSTKDATMYQVFYRIAGQSAFTQFGGNLTATSAVVTGLENGTAYEVAVKAGNSKGFGPYSSTAAGTPNLELLEMPELPAEGRIDNSQIVSIVMADKNNTNSSLCPNFNVAKDLIDNDAATYWIAKNWSLDSTFTFTFNSPQDMNYLLLVPYLDKAYKSRISTYTITAKDESGNTILTLEKKAAPNITERNYLVLPFPETKGIKSLSIALGEKEGGPRVSISEIAFYKSDSMPDKIAELFTDGTFTVLKDGVTLEQIQTLKDRLDSMADFYMDVNRLQDELTLAQKLLNGSADALGLVREGFQSRTGEKDRQYGQSASDFQPVGISAAAGSTVAVYAELPDDKPVSLVPTQYFGESGIWRGSAVQLKPGRNYITTPKIGSLTDPRGGMYYLTYAGGKPEEIKLHIRDSEGVTRIPVLELSGWYDMDEAKRKETIQTYVNELNAHCSANSNLTQTSIQNATEISTPSVLLSLPADSVKAGLGPDAVNTMYQNVLAWEEVLFVANKTQGIIDTDVNIASYKYPMTTRQNIRYMRMFAGAFMYAAGNHIGIGYGSASGLVCGRPTSGGSASLFGWGIAHEIGHNMDKLGKAEITNNIYSLAVQAWDGADMKKQTRLAGFWDRIYDKVSAGRPGAANNVFVQLGMYWQLHLAYDNAGNPLGFYNEFFRRWKNGDYSGKSYDDRVALLASEVTGRDLTEFLTRWGMELSETTKTEIGKCTKEDRAIWYLNDDSYASRLDGNKGGSIEAVISASVAGNTATVTLNSNSENILGYEIRRNGTKVGFARVDKTKDTCVYVDNLGEANNLAYKYSAVPIDILGNIGTEVTAEEVRVSYNKTIDSGLYTVSSEGGKLTITMKSGEVPVTGILTGENSTSCVVRVKAADSEKWTVALNGAVTASQPAYFHKPGAPAEDTRIWTFDAAIIEITGLSDTNIQLLDYPGDRIDFYETAAAGRLKEAYKYGENSEQVIPANTLVIIGTYRGDPVYNTVEIQARYQVEKDGEGTYDDEPEFIERPMNGYSVMFAEIPEDGAVSDTSDGFFIFVPDLEAERALNEKDNVIYPRPENQTENEIEIETENGFPMEIRAVLYRTNEPESSENRRTTSETLWISFPSEDTFPQIELQSTP